MQENIDGMKMRCCLGSTSFSSINSLFEKISQNLFHLLPAISRLGLVDFFFSVEESGHVVAA